MKGELQADLIAGPCGAESREQVLETALQIHEEGIDLSYFRAGVWKPRTRPESFQGVGEGALKWLREVAENYGFRCMTEVANARQVEACLNAGIDAVWVGARTTVNPFTVQEIADALKGSDLPVFIKNPVNPDLGLWIGAVERFHNAGLNKISLIHRGFSVYGASDYRNEPHWQLPIDMMRHFPSIPLLCDCSHILGKRTGVKSLSQFAIDLGYAGLMIETHYDPDNALSDADQQVTPSMLSEILEELSFREEHLSKEGEINKMQSARTEIDRVDKKIIRLFKERMDIADKIGLLKLSQNLQVFQRDRYEDILNSMYSEAEKLGLSKKFVTQIIQAAHQEAIERQKSIYQKKAKAEDSES